MRFNVSIRESQLAKLSTFATVLQVTNPFLTSGFVTCLIECEMSRSEFWDTWQSS